MQVNESMKIKRWAAGGHVNGKNGSVSHRETKNTGGGFIEECVRAVGRKMRRKHARIRAGTGEARDEVQ